MPEFKEDKDESKSSSKVQKINILSLNNLRIVTIDVVLCLPTTSSTEQQTKGLIAEAVVLSFTQGPCVARVIFLQSKFDGRKKHDHADK